MAKKGRPRKAGLDVERIRWCHEQYMYHRSMAKMFSPTHMCADFGLTEKAYRRYINGAAKDG